MFLKKLKKALQKKTWYAIKRAGYEIRRAEDFAFPDQRELLKERQVRTIFDLGANYGEITQLYRDMFPDATVYAFEPIAELAAQLRSRFKHDPKVVVESFAIAENAGVKQFFVNSNKDTSSLLASKQDVPISYKSMMTAAKTVDVNTTTIDLYCKENGIAQIDLLKMDIQGGELSAICGATDMLSKRCVGLIYSEAFLIPFYDSQPLLGEITLRLAQTGYFLHQVYNLSFSSTSGRCMWMDAIYLPDDMLSRSREVLNRC